jgi:hypothetical protein
MYEGDGGAEERRLMELVGNVFGVENYSMEATVMHIRTYLGSDTDLVPRREREKNTWCCGAICWASKLCACCGTGERKILIIILLYRHFT